MNNFPQSRYASSLITSSICKREPKEQRDYDDDYVRTLCLAEYGLLPKPNEYRKPCERIFKSGPCKYVEVSSGVYIWRPDYLDVVFKRKRPIHRMRLPSGEWVWKSGPGKYVEASPGNMSGNIIV